MGVATPLQQRSGSMTSSPSVNMKINDDNAQMPSNENLLRQLQDEDRPYEAFTALVKANSRRFYALAYRLMGNKQDAEDIVQSCFMRIWHRSELWDETKGARFTTWFSRVILNECRMHMRKTGGNAAKPNAQADLSELQDWHESLKDDKAGDMDSALQQKQRAAFVKHAVLQLPDRQREAMVLCFYEGYSNKDAAEIMDVGLKALESLLMRGKKQLTEMLHDVDG